MTTTCWPWSTLEKACLKRAMALHRDSGRSEAACAKAVAADQLATWDTWKPACHAMLISYWSDKTNLISYWLSNSHLVMVSICNSTLTNKCTTEDSIFRIKLSIYHHNCWYLLCICPQCSPMINIHILLLIASIIRRSRPMYWMYFASRRGKTQTLAMIPKPVCLRDWTWRWFPALVSAKRLINA